MARRMWLAGAAGFVLIFALMARGQQRPTTAPSASCAACHVNSDRPGKLATTMPAGMKREQFEKLTRQAHEAAAAAQMKLPWLMDAIGATPQQRQQVERIIADAASNWDQWWWGRRDQLMKVNGEAKRAADAQDGATLDKLQKQESEMAKDAPREKETVRQVALVFKDTEQYRKLDPRVDDLTKAVGGELHQQVVVLTRERLAKMKNTTPMMQCSGCHLPHYSVKLPTSAPSVRAAAQ